jgi:L-arabinose isomerase
MQTKAPKPKIGIMALTLELYETLAPALRVSREEWLRREAIPLLSQKADVIFTGAVYRREAIEALVQRYENDKVDALLVILLAYSPSQIALPALRRTRLPIVIWNTQELFAVDAHFTLGAMIDNHGVHGTQDLANVLLRAGVKHHYASSHYRDPKGLDRLGDFFEAARAVRRLRSARLGMMGYPFPGMGDFAVDSTHLAATLGCSWNLLTLDDYHDRAESADPQLVELLVQDYRRLYAVAGDVTEADLISTACSELALLGLVTDHRLDALTYQFMAFGDDPRTGTLPFVAMSRLMADGIGFGGEGDLIAAAGTAFFNWLNPPASFSEIFTIDYPGNSLFMSHMGEANVAMARRDALTPLVARATPITRTRDRQLALVTSFEPGPATLMALTLGPGQRWRIIAAAVEIADFGPLPALCVPHFKIKLPGDVNVFLTAYAEAGGPHHNAVSFGDARPRLKIAAKMLDADYIEI